VGQSQGVFVSKHSNGHSKTEEAPMSSIATTNETSNVTSLPTAPKPQTTKEVIAANVKLLIEQFEAGHSEGLTAYLTAMGKFHNYSFGNILSRNRAVEQHHRARPLRSPFRLARATQAIRQAVGQQPAFAGLRRSLRAAADPTRLNPFPSGADTGHPSTNSTHI
jgi:hypothetical protein